MYATIRRYSLHKADVRELAHRVEQGFLPMIRRIQGFRRYLVMRSGEDTVISLSVFDTKESADASNRESAAWVQDNVAELVQSGPVITSGEVLLEQEGPASHLDISGVPIGDPAHRIRELFDAFNARDFDRGARHVPAGAEQLIAGTGEVLRGPEGYRKLVERWSRAFPDGRVEVVGLAASGEAAVAEYVGRGTHTGPLVTPDGEIPPTGRRVELRFCDVFRLHNGEITGVTTYFDRADMLRQLGILPQAIPAMPAR